MLQNYFFSAVIFPHLIGAVMYLFRGEFGFMLYTGDFRWEKTSRRAQIGKTMLLNALKNEKIDNLYLDNTYCNPSYSFPSREVAAQQVHVLLPQFFFFSLLFQNINFLFVNIAIQLTFNFQDIR